MAKSVLKQNDPADVPAGQENITTPKVEYQERKDGKVMFGSVMNAYRIPVKPTIVEVVNGRRVIKDPGYTIQFMGGEYLADPKKEIDTVLFGKVSEVDFLRGLIERRIKDGTNYPIHEVKPGSDETGISTDDINYMDILEHMDITDIRRMFDVEEVKRLGLNAATKDRLMILALKLKKPIPEEYLTGKQQSLPV